MAASSSMAAHVRRYRLWLMLAWVAVTGLPAAATMQRLIPAIRNLYVKPVGLGWGFWLCMLSLCAFALIVWLQRLSDNENRLS